jgi:hypothetical protein
MANFKTKVLPANEVSAAGFAKFNDCQHLCVEIPEGWHTITCKTSGGKLVTFSFVPDVFVGSGHQCVDVHHATGDKRKVQRNGVNFEMVCQNVNVFGSGSYKDPLRSLDYYKDNDNNPMTLTSILLTPLDGAD